MGYPTWQGLLIVAIATCAACGAPSIAPDEDPIDPEIALEEMAAYELGLEPPVDVVAYLASMCACGDFVLIDSVGNELRLRWGSEMWSVYPSGFTVKDQEVENENTSWAAQHTLGVWFNRNCSFEREALRHPANTASISPDTTDYLCPLLFNIAVYSEACYLLDEMIKPKGQHSA